jgi:GTPase SAR1 family protein
VLVFDVNITRTFDNLRFWLEEFVTQSAIQVERGTFPLVVVGNKIDRDGQRVVSARRAAAWCSEIGATYIETSAREAINVGQVFAVVAKKAVEAQAKVAPLGAIGVTFDDVVVPGTRTTTTTTTAAAASASEKSGCFGRCVIC